MTISKNVIDPRRSWTQLTLCSAKRFSCSKRRVFSTQDTAESSSSASPKSLTLLKKTPKSHFFETLPKSNRLTPAFRPNSSFPSTPPIYRESILVLSFCPSFRPVCARILFLRLSQLKILQIRTFWTKIKETILTFHSFAIRAFNFRHFRLRIDFQRRQTELSS